MGPHLFYAFKAASILFDWADYFFLRRNNPRSPEFWYLNQSVCLCANMDRWTESGRERLHHPPLPLLRFLNVYIFNKLSRPNFHETKLRYDWYKLDNLNTVQSRITRGKIYFLGGLLRTVSHVVRIRTRRTFSFFLRSQKSTISEITISESRVFASNAVIQSMERSMARLDTPPPPLPLTLTFLNVYIFNMLPRHRLLPRRTNEETPVWLIS